MPGPNTMRVRGGEVDVHVLGCRHRTRSYHAKIRARGGRAGRRADEGQGGGARRRRSLAVGLSIAGVGRTQAFLQLAAVARPGRAGDLRRDRPALEWSGDRKRRSGRRRSPAAAIPRPIVWGNRVFLTTAVEGEVVPGAKAVEAHRSTARSSCTPTAWAPTASTRSRCWPSTRTAGSMLWERTAWEGTPYDARHKQGELRLARRRSRTASASTPTSAPRASTPTTSTASCSGRPTLGGIATLGVGVGTSPVLYRDLVILQCDEDNGDEVVHRRARQEDRQGGLARGAQGPGELGHADRRARGRAATSWSRAAPRR